MHVHGRCRQNDARSGRLSEYQDDLGYHLTQNGNENGIFYAGYVPACYCTVQTYIQPDFETSEIPPELSKWRMTRQELTVPSNKEIIVLKLEPKTEP